MKLEKEVKLQSFKPQEEGICLANVCIDNLSKEEKEIFFSSFYKKTKIKLEIETQILDEAERKYLSGVIRPFRDRVRYIEKYAYICDGNKREFISISTNGGITTLPYFKAETMYKGMTANKEYTLKELGL